MSTKTACRYLPSVAEVLAILLPAIAALAVSWQIVDHRPKPAEARLSLARDHLRGLTTAIVAAANEKGRYPSQDEGLAALVDWQVVAALPLDPWGKPYQYRYPGRTRAYDLTSLGPDGVESADDLHAGNLYPGRP